MENGTDQQDGHQSDEDYEREAKEEMRQALSDDPLLLIRTQVRETELLRELNTTNKSRYLWAAGIAVVAVVLAVAGWTRETEFRYFYINQDGHVYETYGMDYPVANRDRVRKHAELVATSLHTWSYRNFGNRFTTFSDLCSEDVIANYYNNLDAQGVFATARQYKQRYESVGTGANVVKERTVSSDGRMGWRVELVVNEEIVGTTRPITKRYEVVIDINQVPLSVSPKGLQCVRYDENLIGSDQ